MAPKYFPNFPMRVELTKFWSLTFFFFFWGGGGGKEHIVLKIFPIISTLLSRNHICKKHLTFLAVSFVAL